jgi:hypothetical protein
MHSSIYRDEDLIFISWCREEKRREENNIYEDPDEAIYRIPSKAHKYCIIYSDRMISVSKLKSLYTILVKFIYLTVKYFLLTQVYLTLTATNSYKIDPILFYSIQST